MTSTTHRILRIRRTAIVFATLAAPLIAQTASKAVTSVTGPSWLKHLNRRFDQTSMGRSSWQLGPKSDSDSAGAMSALPPHTAANQPVALSGSDLYRMNCQGCHGPAGQGAPPEINSVINPVRATSAQLTLQRMKNVGMEMTASDASKMAREANAALLQRLHNGGENMPAFAYLSEAEIRALIGYLKQLADVPGAAKEEATVRETSVRRGELIAKSTCHICHDATGVNPSPEDLLNGAIPPLSTLTTRTTEAGLVRKVTQGASIAMGSLATVSGGRMPVFHYLTEDEAADVYLYLTEYPPEFSPEQDSSPVERAQILQSAIAGNMRDSGDPPSRGDDSGITPAVVFSLATLFSFGLIGAGFIFTFREFSRLTRHTTILIPLREPPAAESNFMLSVEEERKPA